MLCGLDFGTSHCALGVMAGEQVNLIPLEQGKPYMPSVLYAFDRGLIADYINTLLLKHSTIEQANDYQSSRKLALTNTVHLRHKLDLTANEASTFVGAQAIEEYIEFPEEGYFVKSPKSFLGANGLQANQLDFFEDLTTALMLSVKQKAELALNKALTQVVIGRPVNFQGVNSEKSNQQAINILRTSAKRCGFSQVEFLYEPLAAGIDFESQLTSEKVVLVVDIGGGTTDCSIVKMGPNKQNTDRKDDFLAHTGKRTGGNDLDIYNAFHNLTPLLGMGSCFKTGSTLPRTHFWHAVATNDVVAQNDFFSLSNALSIKQLSRDSAQPNLVKRLLKVQQDKLNHRLVRDAELAKINLSKQQASNAQTNSTQINLDYIEAQLSQNISIDQFSDAINQPLLAIQGLIKAAIKQAQTRPDLIYLTGGSAQSLVVKNAVSDCIKQQLGEDIPLLDGDYFGSVTAGLTKWAQLIY